MKIGKTISWSFLLLLIVAGIYGGKYLYLKPKFINGEKAPDFKAELLDGEPFQLSDLKGNFILLDFWGSWCGPCRAENPGLVKFYDKYKNSSFENAQGFEIVSVGIENNRDRWVAAIEKDNLRWKYHISELESFDSEIAEKFGVKQIPTKYLLSPDLTIIAVNKDMEEMGAVLERFMH